MRGVKRAWPARWSAAALAAAALSAVAPPLADAAPFDEGGPTRVAAFVLDDDGAPVAGARGATLLHTLERALRRDGRLEIVDHDLALARRADLVPDEALGEALGSMSDGEALLRRDRAGAALPRLEQAARAFAENLAFARKRDYAHAQFLIGAAHAMLGNDDEAHEAFTRLLVWRDDYVADASIAPEKVLPRFEAAREALRGRGAGSIELLSSPAGAAAYVDGRFVGFTPTFAAGLTAGEHHVTFRAVGFVRAIVTVEVSSRVERTARVTLEPTPGRAQLEALLDEVAPELDRPRGGPALAELGALLGADHLVVVRLPSSTRGDDPVRGWIYGATSRQRLAAAERSPSDDDGAALAALAEDLYRQIAGEAWPPPARSRRDRGGVALHRRWWFWTGVTVVAAAVVVPRLFDLDGGARCPDGAVCGHVVWRF
jgi:tetratricopeptide (TPR) repeat protein